MHVTLMRVVGSCCAKFETAVKRLATCKRSKGWRSGESTRLPPTWPGFKSWRQRPMWVEFVVGSLLCSERFFSGYSGFLLSTKTNIFKFQFDQESGTRKTTLWICYFQIITIIIICLLFINNFQRCWANNVGSCCVRSHVA